MEYPRKSGISKSGPRPSTMHGPRYTLDPKQFSEKSFQIFCQKEIIAYFQEKCPENPISIKHLQTPNTKDFILILTTLVRKIDKLFELSGKLEDDVPAFFKSMGYPFPISKNSLLAVGAPSSWPSLLACLYWLLENVKMYELAEENESRGNIASDAPDEELCSEHLIRAYELFLQTKDYNEELQRLSSLLSERYEEIHRKALQTREIVEHNRREKEELVHYLRAAGNIDPDIEMALSQMNSVRDFAGLENMIREYARRLENAKKGYNDMFYVSTELDAQVETLATQIKEQKYNKDDIRRFQKEISECTRIEVQKGHEIQLAAEQSWENANLIQSLIQEIHDKLNKYNHSSMSSEIIQNGLIVTFTPEKLLTGEYDELITPHDILERFRAYQLECMDILRQAIEENDRNIYDYSIKIDHMNGYIRDSFSSIEEKSKNVQQMEDDSRCKNEDGEVELEKKKKQIREIDEILREIRNDSNEKKRAIRDTNDKTSMRAKELIKAESEWGNTIKKQRKMLDDSINLGMFALTKVYDSMDRCQNFISSQAEEISRVPYN